MIIIIRLPVYQLIQWVIDTSVVLFSRAQNNLFQTRITILERLIVIIAGTCLIDKLTVSHLEGFYERP